MRRKISVGLNVNTRAPIILKDYKVADIIDLGERLEEFGYHSAWVGDSLISKPRLEPLLTLAAIGARTHKIMLGTATLLLPLRNQFPPLFAHAWATLDVLSNGRTIFGVGVGGGHPRIEDKLEFEMCGVSYKERGSRFEEGLAILKLLWTSDHVSFEGKYTRLSDVTIEPKPLQKPTPPIWIANAVRMFHVGPKTTERIFRRTARMGDGVMTCCLRDGSVFQQDFQQILAYRKEYGGDIQNFEPSHQVTLNISEDVEHSIADMRSFLRKYYLVDYTEEELKAWGPAGNATTIIDWFEDFISHDCRTFVVRFAGQDQYAQFKKFTTEVLPSL
jgi:alkanesulfonate monooxygenase SsuD/methylene tetrahydromethanopterin reductase-like flavin-dependent oxidoreductase (luciferase family)